MFNQNMLCLPQDRGSSPIERRQSPGLSNDGWRYMRAKTIRDTRRKEIITAARDLFSRKGFHGTSIPDIAHAAGISTGLIYYIFPSKEDILLPAAKKSLPFISTSFIKPVTSPTHSIALILLCAHSILRWTG